MAIVKNNYVKPNGAEKSKAKATIRYMQHRPGKTAGHAHAQGGQRADFCCGVFERYSTELGLPLVRDDPIHYMFHSRYCGIFNPRSSFYWSSPVKKNTPLAPPQTSIDHTTPKGNRNERITRTLFGRDGVIERHEAYRMIDESAKGSVFFRFIISPDSKTEDTNRDLRMRDVTEQTMLSFEDHIKQQVQWVGAVHADHTPLRHVHIVAVVPARMQKAEFQTLPQVLRHAATQACIEQRQELDRLRIQQEQGREEAVWEHSH